jgi:hypothetical protein
VDVRRIVVEGVDVNQDALNDEYRTHDVVVLIFYGSKVKHFLSIIVPFPVKDAKSGRSCNHLLPK